jgi:hypothetical protein
MGRHENEAELVLRGRDAKRGVGGEGEGGSTQDRGSEKWSAIQAEGAVS